MTTPIPDPAISAAADVMEAMDGADLTAVAEESLKAALPHLLADYRERLVEAAAKLGAIADERTEEDSNYFRIIGKQQGVNLALSYLDEILRTP